MREVAHAFNYTRMGDNVIASISRGIDYALAKNRITATDDRIKLTT